MVRPVYLEPLEAVFVDFEYEGVWEPYSPGTFVIVFITPERDLPYTAYDAGDSGVILQQILKGYICKGYGLVSGARSVSLFHFIEPEEHSSLRNLPHHN